MFSSLFLLIFGALSLGNPDPCLENFNAAYHSLKDAQKNSKGILINYSVEMVTDQGQKQREHLILKSTGSKSMIKSGLVTVFQDVATMVALQSDEKTIFITRPIPATWKKAQLAGILNVQDSLIAYLSLKSCSADLLNGKSVQKIVFDVKGRLKNTGVNTVSYWIDDQSMKSILIEYNETRPIKSWRVFIEQLDTSYSSDPFQGSAISQALDKNNKVKKDFYNYKVIDKRNSNAK